ncbi:MAG: cytidylyltransferase domain-containing protein [Roseibacillus sp.]
MTVLVVIPARAGSKGVPDKNLKEFCGVPLGVRTVELAKQSEAKPRVLVSTDSEHYATVFKEAGAEVPFLRPAELSGDAAKSEDALLHALDWLEKEDGYQPDVLVFLQCTSPFLRPEDIDGCLRLIEDGADCAFTVAPSHAFLWKHDSSAGAVGINHDSSIRLRRQDLEPEFRETGACYAMKTAGFCKHQHRFFGKIAFHTVPEKCALEIDSLADWQLCETLAQLEMGRCERGSGELPQAIVFDFDGVFTDNQVSVSETGEEAVVCSRSDGLGVALFREKYPDVKLLILSKERNPVVLRRAEKLKLEVLHGIDDKVDVLSGWLKSNEISWKDIAYLGNDLNDLGCLRKAGLGVAVGDAYPEVKSVAQQVLKRDGGKGAVREFLEAFLKSECSG